MTNGIEASIPTCPGIVIEGFGTIPLPVNKPIANALIPFFDKAPHGLGEKTVLNEEVRKTWQISPRLFSITNEGFTNAVKSIVPKIKKDLGCSDAVVEIELYKLLLYEEGGLFKPHKDTEKTKGMFGTLVVQLPSIFTGGDLVINHASKMHRFKFDQKGCELFCLFSAHYSDVEHSIEPVTSGYRLALVYSLLWKGNGLTPCAEKLKVNVNALEILLDQNELCETKKNFCWLLDHGYSDDALGGRGCKALKGKDSKIFLNISKALNNINEKREDGYTVCLLKINKTVIDAGECILEEYDCPVWIDYRRENCLDVHDEDYDENYNLTKFTEKGYVFSVNHDYDCDNFHNFEFLNYEDYVDDESWWGDVTLGPCSGPSGNEGATREKWYNKYAITFEKESEIEQELANKDIDNFIDYTIRLCLKPNDSKLNRVKNILIHSISLNNQKFYSSCISVENVFGFVKRIDPKIQNEFFHAMTNIDTTSFKGTVDVLGVIIYHTKHLTTIFPSFVKKFEEILEKQNITYLSKFNKLCVQKNYDMKPLIQRCVNKKIDKLFKITSLTPIEAELYFKILFDNYSGDQDNFKKLVKFILAIKNNDAILDSVNSCLDIQNLTEIPILNELIEARIKSLELVSSAGEPTFSWEQPKAEIFNHPTVTNFLRSSMQIYVYQDFNNIRHARNWAKKHFGPQNNFVEYSADVYCSGIGRNAKVTIVKNRKCFDASVLEFKEYMKTCEKLKSLRVVNVKKENISTCVENKPDLNDLNLSQDVKPDLKDLQNSIKLEMEDSKDNVKLNEAKQEMKPNLDDLKSAMKLVIKKEKDD